MPFGCANYEPGEQIKIDISLYHNEVNAANQIGALSEIVTTLGGVFHNVVKRTFLPSVASNQINSDNARAGLLKAGESISSPKGQYVCRLEFDGALAIYDLHATDPGKPIEKSDAMTKLNKPTNFYAVFIDSMDGTMWVSQLYSIYTAYCRSSYKTTMSNDKKYQIMSQSSLTETEDGQKSETSRLSKVTEEALKTLRH